MKQSLITLLVASCSLLHAQTPAPVSEQIKGPFPWKSTIYPGTERNYWVYVPKQYDPSRPACTLILQDGLSRATGWNLLRVLDSLIALKQIPVIIGIFIDHGKVASGADNYPRFNRSFEYDALGDRYARFLLEEIIPEVSKSYNLSKDPNDRSIGGASSGAICAFNAAWERPNEFRRVLSTIGTYVGLRGGDEFATLVRKSEPKPLRVFLQDGTKDLNIYGGDWWVANQGMLSALTYAGYEVEHAWGEGGGHDSKHSITIMADALKWLWKDYPAPVQTHKGISPRLSLLVDGESWKEIPASAKVEKLAINKSGEVFMSGKQIIFKLDKSGTVIPFAQLKGAAGGLSFSEDGKLYVGDLIQHKVVTADGYGVKDVAANIDANFLAASAKGIYFSDTAKDRVGFYSFAKKDVQYFTVPGGPTGLALTAEQTFLNVGVANSVLGYSFRIADDGKLESGQDYFHFQVGYGATTSGALGMTVDAENLLYTATAMGVQVLDQLGRTNFIFAKPAAGASDVKLGGTNFNVLYSICDGKLYSRTINAKGVLSWLPPVKPSAPRM